LRLESTDGEYLVLEAPDGTTYRLLIDEALRKSVRRETVSADDSNRISPRDIQLEVRSGVTIEELAAKTGASLEYIEKFAAPVVDELAHVVSSALSVRITMAGDRYNETTQVEFGEVVANRLAATGVIQHSWSARKSDNHGWQLHCRYGDNQATWAFDPRKLALSPENELAIQLSTQQSLTDSPIPRLRPVGTATTSITVVPDVEPEPQASSAESFHPTFANPVPVAPVLTPVPDVTPQPVEAAPVAEVPVVAAPVVAEAPAEVESLANTADLLDALRKRRIEREREVLAAATGAIPIVPEASEAAEAFEPEVLSEVSAPYADEVPDEEPYETPEEAAADIDYSDLDAVDEFADTAVIDTVSIEPEVDSAPEPEPESEKPKRAGRSSMPSWDEIVFNTRHDDE
jgi:hypothetical protein